MNQDKKRLIFFATPPVTIFLKMPGVLDGFPYLERDEEKIKQKREAEAKARSLNLQAYRPEGDTGYPLFQRETKVGIEGFLNYLSANYALVKCFYQDTQKGPVSTLIFRDKKSLRPDDLPQKIPQSILAASVEDAYELNLWVNPPKNNERTDTVNLRPISGMKVSRQLVRSGNTYRLQ